MKKRKLTHLGMQIRTRLLQIGMTQTQLAEKVGTTKVYLNYILHGERSGRKYIGKICEILDIEQEEQEETILYYHYKND